MTNRTSFGLLAILGAAFSAFACAAPLRDSPPVLEGATLKFWDGQSIQLPAKEADHAVVAQRFSLHVDEPSKRAFVIRTETLSEEARLSLYGYDYDGNVLFKRDGFTGTIHFIPGKQRIFLARVSSHYLAKDSELVAFDGRRVAALVNPASAQFAGLSKDGKYIWLASENLGGQISYEVMVYDTDGRLVLHEKTVPSGGSLRISGGSYRFDLDGLIPIASEN